MQGATPMLQGVDRQVAAHRQALERCCLPLRSDRRHMNPLLPLVRHSKRSRVDFRFRWKAGLAADIAALTEFDPQMVFGAFTRLAYRP
jgi:hypothetical protein